MPQQYITIPVSLGMGSAQPIQILANPPIMAGLQQFAMIPGHVGATPDSNVSALLFWILYQKNSEFNENADILIFMVKCMLSVVLCKNLV